MSDINPGAFRKTHCKRGHLRTPENVYPNYTCKICMQERHAANHPYKPRSPFCKSGLHPRSLENIDKSYYCKLCRQMRVAEWSRTPKGREYHRKYAREHRKRNPEWKKKRDLIVICRKYGISVEQYGVLLANHGNKCGICKSAFDSSHKTTKLCVDHDHATGRIRGLLCGGCNLAIGFFKEDRHRFENAISYLDNPPAESILTSIPFIQSAKHNLIASEANLSANIN